MGVAFRYQAPTVNALARLAAAKEAAELAGGHVLLDASKSLVPVETGEMRDSGKVEHSPAGAVVSYTRTGADGYNVAARQHEDATLNHPNGGESHFLSKPMASEGEPIIEAMAAIVRKAISE